MSLKAVRKPIAMRKKTTLTLHADRSLSHGPISEPGGVEGFFNMRNIQKWQKLQSENTAIVNDQNGGPRFANMAQIDAFVQQENELMDDIFIYNSQNNTMTIDSSYKYEVDLDKIENAMNLLWWVDHLSTKQWMPKRFLREFIRRVAKVKGWQHGR